MIQVLERTGIPKPRTKLYAVRVYTSLICYLTGSQEWRQARRNFEGCDASPGVRELFYTLQDTWKDQTRHLTLHLTREGVEALLSCLPSYTEAARATKSPGRIGAANRAVRGITQQLQEQGLEL